MRRRGALSALALLALGGCGRIGPVKPPGPREAITYPRAYPKYDDLPSTQRQAQPPPPPPPATPMNTR